MNTNIDKISSKKKDTWFFVLEVFIVFIVTFTLLYFLDLVPEGVKTNTERGDESNISASDNGSLRGSDETSVNRAPQTQTIPERITIDSIGVDINIENPQTQNITLLDQALERGAVYYPGSGVIENGNIFIFGHSADRFLGVTNPALKAFNGIKDISVGDEIKLTADGKEYIYSVNVVELVDANNALVEFSNTGRTLTLSTCDTFGAAQDRYVVEATFKSERNITVE